MIAALAKAGAVLQNSTYLDAAEKSFQFLEKNLIIDGNLKHRYKQGEAEIDAFADDYAFLVWAAIELYEATFNSDYLESALSFNKAMIEKCWDSKLGGFFQTKDSTDQPLGLQKHIYDGAIPSANSVGMLNLLRLSKLTGITDFEQKADAIGKFFSSELIRAGSSITLGISAIQFVHHNPKEIVISEGNTDTKPFISVIRTAFNPQKVLVFRPQKEDKIRALSSYVIDLLPKDGRTSIYICTNYSCAEPVTDVNNLDVFL